MPKRLPSRSALPSEDDRNRSKDELLKELKKLRREYVNLKILEYEHDKAKGYQAKGRNEHPTHPSLIFLFHAILLSQLDC